MSHHGGIKTKQIHTNPRCIHFPCTCLKPAEKKVGHWQETAIFVVVILAFTGMVNLLSKTLEDWFG